MHEKDVVRRAEEMAAFTNALAEIISRTVQDKSRELGWSDDSGQTLVCWVIAALAFAARTAPVGFALETSSIEESREVFLKEAARCFDEQVTYLLGAMHGGPQTQTGKVDS